MNKKSQALDHFGETFIQFARDNPISIMDKTLEGQMKSLRSAQLHQFLQSLNEEQREMVKSLVPEIVDLTLHYFMWLLEDEWSTDVHITIDSETFNLREISDGLCGELYTEDGWISRFSKERHSRD